MNENLIKPGFYDIKLDSTVISALCEAKKGVAGVFSYAFELIGFTFAWDFFIKPGFLAISALFWPRNTSRRHKLATRVYVCMGSKPIFLSE